MGEHRHNPIAQANSEPRKMVQAIDLGDEFALIGLQLMPALDESKENLVVLLAAIGGRNSPLVPLQPKPVVIMELTKVPLASIRRALGGEAPAAVTPAVEPAAEPEAPKLSVVP